MTIKDQQLKQRLQKVSQLNGSGTELISVYIPVDESLSETVQQLNQEHAEAENIKSKSTRKHVQGALNKIRSVLKQYQETPENGIAIFAGYIPEEDDYIMEVFDQFPSPIQDSAYHCDKKFYTEPLENAVSADGDYVLIVFDKNDAVIGEVLGTSVKPIETLSSLVPGKTQKGGFCLAPDTKVITPTGKKRTINTIEIGDKILGTDFDTNKPQITTVINKWTNKKQTVTLKTKDPQFELEASQDHTVFIKQNDTFIEKEVQKLTTDDNLIFHPKLPIYQSILTNLIESKNNTLKNSPILIDNTNNILTTEIESITKNEYTKVIDIETNCHNFVANGLIVHNSQQRFERLREEAKENFFKDIAESVNNRYISKRHNLDGILIGAPEPTKTEFVNGEYLHHELQNKIISKTSISTTTEAGLRQLLQESQDVIQDQQLTTQRKYCEKFMKGLTTDEIYVTYGVDPTVKALDYGAVDTLLVSEQLPPETKQQLSTKTKQSETDDILEYLQNSVQEYGSSIEFISTSFDEGSQFKQAFGGIGAILRYPLN